MKPNLLLCLWGVAVYAGILTFAPLPDDLLLFPSTRPIDAGHATRRLLPRAGGKLEIWDATSQLARRRGRVDVYVLRFYGNADRAENWVADEAEMWSGRAVEVWGVNYPGFGASTGRARLSKLALAGLTAYDELRKEAGKRPIVVFAASMGTTVALEIGAKRPVAGLILQNPPPLREILLRQYGWWNLWLLAGPLALKIPHDLDAIANARASHSPAIFVLAGHDEVVAPRFQALVANAYAGEKRIIRLPQARHNSPLAADEQAQLRQAFDWLLPR